MYARYVGHSPAARDGGQHPAAREQPTVRLGTQHMLPYLPDLPCPLRFQRYLVPDDPNTPYDMLSVIKKVDP